MRSILLLTLSALSWAQAPAPPAINRVRFYPAPAGEQAMLGGHIEGSNISPSQGFAVLATISSVPAAGQWTELTFENHRVYRWLRYLGPPGSYGKIAELEFYSGQRKLGGLGGAYGSVSKVARHSWQQAFDGKTDSWFESHLPDAQFVAMDLRDLATARTPVLDPPPGVSPENVRVALKCPTQGAVIRYTLDGSTPTANHGVTYNAPIEIGATQTIAAVAFLPDRAPSPLAWGTYLISSSSMPGYSTFHLGNSLTQTTAQFGRYARTALYRHDSTIFAMPGAPTIKLWNAIHAEEKDRWQKTWNAVKSVDQLTLQPRDFNVAEEADYCIRFFNLVREKSPDMQPWLYVEWTGAPALTWQESMSAMLLYVEELQTKIAATYHDGKRPRVLPTALAMGWIWNMIENGKFPGLARDAFYPALFRDQVHPNANGAYLVDLTWYSAFYHRSPEGNVLPVATDWNPQQTAVLQRLAWDVIRNYPDCGMYEEGKTPVAKPRFSPGPRVTLSSSTPGAWFRYTPDGTTPTRTRGYVYCGVISVRPGMTVKAIAYESGMADSEVSEAVYAK